MAEEVEVILERMEKTYGIENIRVSFIGFSMGGLTIRSAISYLPSKYTRCLYNYISMSTPHLGCQYKAHPLISTGMWFMEKLDHSKCLMQMSMRDSDELNKTYLYRLAGNKVRLIHNDRV